MILNDLNQILLNSIEQYAKSKSIEINLELKKQINFEISSDSARGDYASSCCLKLSKLFGLSPRDLANEIKPTIADDRIVDLKIEGPGFINVFISAEQKYDALKKLIKVADDWGKSDESSGKILLEFVSSNPTGPLHVGHGRGAVLGMAIANLLERIGYKVTKEYYVNDAGRQISILTSSVILNAYVNNFESDGTYEGAYIKGLADEFKQTHGDLNNEIILEGLDDDKDKRLDDISSYLQTNFKETWDKARNFSVERILEIIKKDLHSFNIVHDVWFKESSLGKAADLSSDLYKSLKIINEEGHTFEKDGAQWFKTTAFGDDKDRVLLRENGEPTYYLTDVGYHKNKIDREFDHYINIFGADHHGYIPRLTSAFNVLKKDTQKIEFLLYQLVNLYEEGIKKMMSTRKGEFYSLSDLRDELGPDVIKFFFLEKKSDHAMDFDMDLAKDESKNNPYFYAQYAHVRCCSILSKANYDPNKPIDLAELDNCFEIISKATNYPIFIKEYAVERSPHSLVHFIKEFSAAFHSFYERSPVITEDEIISNSRLLITKVTKQILKNSFKILNVEPLEKM
jgi:arginyl-tRNA synthetase